MKKQTRNSTFELLRIISMFLIVLHHSVVHTDWPNTTSFLPNQYVVQFLSVGGKLGSNLFIMITAWFLIDKSFSWKRIKKTWLTIACYTIGITVIMLLFGDLKLDLKVIVEAVLPVLTYRYWFATNYLILLALAPFLSQAVQKMSYKDLRNLLLVLFGIFCGAKTLMNIQFGSNVIWFVFLYLTVGFFKKYKEEILPAKRCFLLFFSGLTLLYASILAMNLIKGIYPEIKTVSTYLAAQDSVLIFVMSISLFLIFAQMKPFTNKGINYLAGTMFGVYLFHDNKMIRPLIWDHWSSLTENYNSQTLVLQIFAVVFIVFAVSIIIEILRQTLFTLGTKTKQLIK